MAWWLPRTRAPDEASRHHQKYNIKCIGHILGVTLGATPWMQWAFCFDESPGLLNALLSSYGPRTSTKGRTGTEHQDPQTKMLKIIANYGDSRNVTWSPVIAQNSHRDMITSHSLNLCNSPRLYKTVDGRRITNLHELFDTLEPVVPVSNVEFSACIVLREHFEILVSRLHRNALFQDLGAEEAT